MTETARDPYRMSYETKFGVGDLVTKVDSDERGRVREVVITKSAIQYFVDWDKTTYSSYYSDSELKLWDEPVVEKAEGFVGSEEFNSMAEEIDRLRCVVLDQKSLLGSKQDQLKLANDNIAELERKLKHEAAVVIPLNYYTDLTTGKVYFFQTHSQHLICLNQLAESINIRNIPEDEFKSRYRQHYRKA